MRFANQSFRHRNVLRPICSARSKRSHGFSLIELLIVVAIIGIIAAIAVPNLQASRRAANQASAVSTLRTYHTAEMAFRNGNGFLVDFVELKNLTAGGIDEVLGSQPNNVPKSGYYFTIGPGILPAGADPTQAESFMSGGVTLYRGFYIQADPIQPGGISATGRNGYYIDLSGVIRVEVGATGAQSTSPSLGTQSGN